MSKQTNVTESPDKLIRVMYPGTKVQIEALEATVFPISFKDIKKFSQKIITALTALAAMRGMSGSNPAEIQSFIQKSVGPLILQELLDLVASCTVIKDNAVAIEDLPHWLIAPIIDAFLKENFEGERIHPWKKTIQGLIEQGNRLQEQSSTKETPSS